MLPVTWTIICFEGYHAAFSRDQENILDMQLNLKMEIILEYIVDETKLSRSVTHIHQSSLSPSLEASLLSRHTTSAID